MPAQNGRMEIIMAKKGLGKGLGALFDTEDSKVFYPEKDKTSENTVVNIKISLIEPNKEQPRKVFDEEKLKVLSDSIKTCGVIQPIIVSEADNGYYQIIAGERRWRASRLAGLKEIPAIVRSYEKQQSMEIALVENLQREDLNPIEEALGYKSLLDEFSLTQETVSQRVGKSRSAVANSLRLLSLKDNIQKMISDGLISGGHARAILSVDEKYQDEFANQIVSAGLSVRQAEKMAQKLREENIKEKKTENKDTAIEMQLKEIQSRLSTKLGTKVKIISKDKKGKIEMEYYGKDDFERVLNLLNL